MILFLKFGHCTRCETPFAGNSPVAFMVWERIAWATYLGDWNVALTQRECVPVCAACLTDDEQAKERRDATCGGCGLPMRFGTFEDHRRTVSCSARCDQRVARKRKQARRLSRQCPQCSTPFRPARADARFCSAACKQAAYRQRALAPVPCTASD